ncbi:hypothetical protein A2U01_0102255, partial [Trifolium medium]|nr:hypothetical protein [Trifolium medium]
MGIEIPGTQLSDALAKAKA